ncbi:MAG: DedA family protein [Ignavibacteriae bacterium]|nr:DedA family protein [Ignavibacteriota bacterium]
MDAVVTWITGLDIGYIYLAVFLISYIENIFPPFPSDVVVVFAGSVVGLGVGSAPVTVLLASIGSTLGFLTMYEIGRRVGDRVLETGRIKFISVELVRKVEDWFRRWGYWIIVLNRFMAGTRAVVSFGAGMSELRLLPTLALSLVSAALWNVLLVTLGAAMGANWRDIGSYLSTYSGVVSIVIATGLLGWGLVAWLRSRKRRQNGAGGA